ncbi:hypothetical protein SUGI_0009420 [Cryptomeria japonica]|nr:hypothetical protein SUGI_0009420 [Cryptomeria japonica]
MSTLVYSCIVVGQDTNGLDRLQLGYSSLSLQENETILVSPDGTFSNGFYNVDINAYYLVVWYSRMPKSKTMVWMANRIQTINERDSCLRFLNNDNLLLLDASEIPIWRTNTKGLIVKEDLLLNTGNLVLHSDSRQIV